MLYHYTDLNAVKSIIEGRSIRLTNINYLNDKSEFNIGLSYLITAFRKHYVFPEGVPEKCIRSIRENFTTNFGDNSKPHPLMQHLFVASFSLAQDVLSQYRGYGIYTLEISNSIGMFFPENDTITLLRCIYTHTEEQGRKHAIKVINDITKVVIDSWHDEYDNSHLIANMIEKIAMYALTFKHPAFSEEKEARIIYNNSNGKAKTEFRVKNDILVPYITHKIKVEVITNVIVGPMENQALAAESLTMFAEKIKREYRLNRYSSDYWDLKVTKSDIPFRAN